MAVSCANGWFDGLTVSKCRKVLYPFADKSNFFTCRCVLLRSIFSLKRFQVNYVISSIRLSGRMTSYDVFVSTSTCSYHVPCQNNEGFLVDMLVSPVCQSMELHKKTCCHGEEEEGSFSLKYPYRACVDAREETNCKHFFHRVRD